MAIGPDLERGLSGLNKVTPFDHTATQQKAAEGLFAGIGTLMVGIAKFIPVIGSYIAPAYKGKVSTEKEISPDRVSQVPIESDLNITNDKIAAAIASVVSMSALPSAVGKEPFNRGEMVAKLFKLTGFTQEQFTDFTDEQLENLKANYELSDGNKSSFAVFSKRSATEGPDSIILSLDPVSKKLKLVDRSQIVAKLSEATGFDQTKFKDLSDAQIAKFVTVYQELEGATKTSGDIRTSMSGERLTFAKFSRRVFQSLPVSISLYIDPDTEKLQLIEDLHEVIGSGGFKKAKLARGEVKDYVRGVFLPTVSSPERDNILAEQLRAYQALRSKVTPEQLKYLCLPEVVTYKSAKTGRIKKILLSPYMNKRDLQREQYVIPPDQRVAVMLQIAKGVKAMHDSGFAHMDIKGPNILLHKEADGTFVAKLTDFDLTTDTSKPGSHPGFGNVISTYTYMAPELDTITSPVHNRRLKRCDIYSLGVVFSHFDIAGSIPEGHRAEFEQLANEMLSDKPAERPTIEQVIQRLEAME